MAYDANGNLTKDLDRDIVTIKYNLLNLPEIIQFKNGNQIRNLYDASGQKLSTRNVTIAYFITEPIIAEEDIYDLYDMAQDNEEIYLEGTEYIGNVEYSHFESYYMGGFYDQGIDFQRLYNSEGYCDNNLKLNYYRRDHLGNNREVWRAPYTTSQGATVAATTIQRTQYYPSGLPWASNSGDNPWTQNKKYNGKEWVEMHGYDTYDIVWRQYYPAIGRFQTPDPEIEEAYNESPYAMCDNNMVNRTDPDGRIWNNVIGGVVGGLVEYGGQVAANIYENKGISASAFTENIDLADIALAAGEGFLTSGGSVMKNTVLKAAVIVGAETGRNLLDAKTTENGTNPKLVTNSFASTVKNTAIGLTLGKIGDAVPTPKIKVMNAPTSKQAVSQARVDAKAKGTIVNRQQRVTVQNKAKQTQKVATSVNNNASNLAKTPLNATAGGTSETIKRKTDEKKIR